ncbi:hypothetical protein V1514DRAFT_301195 [Lipomyces japonicus]|uniref:uncharacterized protein n=1 Tax=Lipomyces japonicus TaxID=56871 RepID=UPI0034CD5268
MTPNVNKSVSEFSELNLSSKEKKFLTETVLSNLAGEELAHEVEYFSYKTNSTSSISAIESKNKVLHSHKLENEQHGEGIIMQHASADRRFIGNGGSYFGHASSLDDPSYEELDTEDEEISSDFELEGDEKYENDNLERDTASNNSSYTVQCGWIVLFSTWIIFVSGIGSMFGVWKWVWAPALQYSEGPFDESNILIDEYYPSMVMLLCVVAWIWCIVSWVGMKLFRHAKGGTSSDAKALLDRPNSPIISPT